MARGNCTFRQRDVTAAVRAAIEAGVQVARIEVDTEGKICIVLGDGVRKLADELADELDQELAEWASGKD